MKAFCTLLDAKTYRLAWCLPTSSVHISMLHLCVQQGACLAECDVCHVSRK